MFGRTVICIYNNQLNDNPRPKRPHYEQTETYSDEEENHYDTDTTQTESDTESENETKNQAGTQNKPKNKPEVRLEARLFKAKKFTTQLQATDFCDTGNLNNATKQEKVNIIALSMYNRLSNYEPSNEFIRKYKHQDILDKYKQISEKRTTKSNTLLELYDILQTIELRIEQLKFKNKNKGNKT